VSGFATHAQLKAGTIDSVKRLYHLDSQVLTEDLNVLWTLRSLHPKSPESPESPDHASATALPTLSLDQLEALLDQLSQPTPYSPRLEVPFQQWAALLANPNHRQVLYQRRQTAKLQSTPALTNLRQWLQQVTQTLGTSWQTVEAVIAPLSPAVRGSTSSNATWDAIAPVLQLVKTTTSEQIRQQAAGVLGEIGADYPEAIDTLVELLQTTQEEETRWQAALSLGKLAPQHPLAGIRRARLIDLGLQIDHQEIALIVALMPKPGDRIGVFLQVQAIDQQSNLPPHLKLSILSESGETRLQAETRRNELFNSKDISSKDISGKDKSINLRFSPPAGTRFCAKIELNHSCIIEEFLT
jgi:Protein of unknown function (DUF1822)